MEEPQVARFNRTPSGFLAGFILIVLFLTLPPERNSCFGQNLKEDAELAKIPFDGKASYGTLKRICDLGPRITGSDAMSKQQEILAGHFSKLGAKIRRQRFQVLHPETREKVDVVNLIVQWHPQSQRRLILCCHYDTRPFPDSDVIDPRGRFIGANDGASGVALFHELGKHMPKIQCSYGVDFVFFDAEEFVFDKRRDPLFVGSEYFARNYIQEASPVQYVSGVLIDMIGDRELQIYYEKNSMQFAPVLTRGIWNTARKLGVREFIPRQRHKIRDDHLPLNNIARIPTTDIIDFDYPSPNARRSYWHTRDDTVDKCSALSLAKVGWVLLEWLKTVR